ncbi:MAG: YcaQ family DNA glycosylase [Bacilli bacterium]|nr:YcaQ family DNA glycosylase [Bacilli bacterium]MBN2876261.1 YcaQ family DNA glycosylase [Bacilli bacterium]
MLHWTKQEAREYLLRYQYINTEFATSLMQVFQRIQTIQVDPLNVVGTNMELVLQARIKDFKPKDLYYALYRDRTIIDGWDRQMSMFLTSDFPKFKLVREQRAKADLQVVKKYLGFDSSEHIDDVLNEIRTRGPLFSKDISFGEVQNNRWGRNKPSASTLDYLFFLGKIGVYDRNKTQKQYDLIENLIPNHNDPFPFLDLESFLDCYVYRRIQTSGLTRNKQVPFYGAYINDAKTRTKHIKRLVANKSVTEIKVEGISEILYAPTSGLDLQDKIQDRITFLAPLDNLIWDRVMLNSLFDFDYTWEVYTPVKKRKYGYYVLPIIRAADIIGRIEFENYKGIGPLQVKSIWLEDKYKDTKAYRVKLHQALKRFCRYLDAPSYIMDNQEVLV